MAPPQTDRASQADIDRCWQEQRRVAQGSTPEDQARLLAAAPDLLDALTRVLNDLPRIALYPLDPEVKQAARDAIVRAGGVFRANGV